jgi:hypothetical protein
MMSSVRSVLIVANQTIGGSELSAAVSERLDLGECTFHLVVPVPPTPPSVIAAGLAAIESAAPAMIDVPDQRIVAAERLEAGIEWLRELGATATGEVGSTDAVASVGAVVERVPIDEIIVSTLPSRLSRWLKQDLPCKLGRAVSVPITVVTAGSEQNG